MTYWENLQLITDTVLYFIHNEQKYNTEYGLVLQNSK